MMRKDQDAVPLTDERETAMKEDRMDIEPNEGAEIARGLAKRWVHEAELIPITHLSIDVTEPIAGWALALLERGVEIVDDDLGRPCVRREVLGDLLAEERERLARIAAESAVGAVAPVSAGVPAGGGCHAVRVVDGQRSLLRVAFGGVRRAPEAAVLGGGARGRTAEAARGARRDQGAEGRVMR
jgi:hypothetical protein